MNKESMTDSRAKGNKSDDSFSDGSTKEKLKSVDPGYSWLITSDCDSPISSTSSGESRCNDSTNHEEYTVQQPKSPIICQHCMKSFHQLYNFARHIRIHTGEKPYKCEHCGKYFADSSNLKVHLRLHTGEHPYKCDHCDKSFADSGHLKVHLRLHSGELPYKCDKCGKCFRQKSNLNVHLRMHTRNKNYVFRLEDKKG